MTLASQDSSFAERLVYLTGIPTDASEQEVTDLVGSFGKINNVILMPCSEEESEKGEGQKVLNKRNIMVILQEIFTFKRKDNSSRKKINVFPV